MFGFLGRQLGLQKCETPILGGHNGGLTALRSAIVKCFANFFWPAIEFLSTCLVAVQFTATDTNFPKFLYRKLLAQIVTPLVLARHLH